MSKTEEKERIKLKDIDTAMVRRLAEYGHTDEFMADFFGVTISTWSSWKKCNPEFFRQLKGWKGVADDRVERALYERALGYEWEEDAIVWDKFERERVQIRLEKRLPPDTTACIFWLKNRRRADWRDKLEVDNNHTGSVAHSVRVDPVELEERIKLIAGMAAEERVNQIDFGKALENALQ